jgi:4-aminobutyrate aminotransferase-like enzyme
MIGTEFIADGNRAKEKQMVKDVIHAAEEKGMLLLSCGTYDNIVRWIPPLNLTSEQVNDGLKIFGEALKESIK